MYSLIRLRSGKAIVNVDGVARLVSGEGTDEQILGRFNQAATAQPDDEPPPRAQPASRAAPDSPAREMRRKKMRQISDTSVGSRGRAFDNFPHVPMMDQHRHIDLMFMVLSGELKDDDKILTRHLKSGEYQSITVAEWKEQMRKSFWMRQELRKQDQLYRDKVNTICNDNKLSDQQKCAAMEALVIPEHLNVDTDGKIK